MSGALRVAVDYRPVEGKRAGIGRYVYEILQRVCSRSDFELSLISSRPFRPIAAVQGCRDLDRPGPRLAVPFPFKKVIRLCYTEPTAHAMLTDAHIDLLWGTTYFFPLALAKGPWKRVVTVHDLASRYYPEALEAPMLGQLNRLEEHVAVADRVLAVSETTKRDLVKFLNVAPGKIEVVYNGVSERFRRLDGVPERVKLQYRLPERFLLFVGTVEPRKNLPRLIKAFDAAARKIPHALVIVGAKGWKAAPMYRAITESPFRDRILFTGYVDDDDLPALYNLADVLVYPSLYEGFGIPVVEAMACGTPVMTSNGSALAEIADGAAVLVDPLDVGRIGEAIERVVGDEPLRADLRAKGFERAKHFSWDVAASQVVACFQALCGRPVSASGPR